jgi:hypothetical protein
MESCNPKADLNSPKLVLLAGRVYVENAKREGQNHRWTRLLVMDYAVSNYRHSLQFHELPTDRPVSLFTTANAF